MDWNSAREWMKSQEIVQGVLYRGVENQGTLIRSSTSVLEIGPVKWELPKNVRFDREERKWSYEDDEGQWRQWEDAEKQGVGAFFLLDPRWYLEVMEPASEIEETYFPGLSLQHHMFRQLHVKFDSSVLFDKMRFTPEIAEWYQEVVGSAHNVSFTWNTSNGNMLIAMTQRDFWLTYEPVTVLLHMGSPPPSQLSWWAFL